MAFRNSISGWFGSQPKSNRQETSIPAKNDTLHTSEELEAIAAPPQDEPVQYHSSFDDAKRHWFKNETLAQRIALLREHPFFETPNYTEQLDIETYLSLVACLGEIHKNLNRYGPQHYQRVFHGMTEVSPETREAFDAANKGNASAFESLQKHGFLLAQQFPAEASKLYETMADHWNILLHNGRSTLEWLNGFEQLASVGVLPDVYKTIGAFYEYTKNQPNIVGFLNDYPHLYDLCISSKNDTHILHWSMWDLEKMGWLLQSHPRFNAWDIAETIFKSSSKEEAFNKTAELAQKVPEGALLKAWFGIELSVEEMTKHPLAHALYVHRHAPMYLEEVKPLPSSWTVAMSLAETGRQFCEALVQTARMSLGQEKVVSVELPDLDGPSS